MTGINFPTKEQAEAFIGKPPPADTMQGDSRVYRQGAVVPIVHQLTAVDADELLAKLRDKKVVFP